MNRKNRLEKLQELTKQAELKKISQAINEVMDSQSADVNDAKDSEAEKILQQAMMDTFIPGLDG